jgi:transcriptional regulator with XRE-family HTH domain
MKPEDLANSIRIQREARGLSPVSLARLSGVNMLIVGALERGDMSNISVAQLLKVADCLKLQVSIGASTATSASVVNTPAASEASPSEPTPATQPKPVPANLQIRIAEKTDANAISELIRSFAHEFTTQTDGQGDGQGAEAFMQSISPEGIAQVLDDSDYRYYTGWIGQSLAGVIAVKNNTHVFHWFVRADMQKRGLGRKLWLYVKSRALASGQRCCFTVNASLNSVPAYERLGFEVVGESEQKNGIRFTPMQWGTVPQAQAD